MRAVTDFLLPELLKLLLDAPPVDPYASEESESQSQSQSQPESQARGNGGVNAAALPQTQPRVMIVRDTNPPAQTITVVDRSFAIDAFLPQQVIAAQVLEKYGFARLSALRGSLIRIEKYHFSTPQRCEAARAKQLMSREQARVCLWVDEISVIDATSSLSVNSMPHIDENARVAVLLQELGDDQLNMRLTVRQRLLPFSNTPHGVEQFDDNHPLEDDDCIIPEDQEAQLEAQDGWGVSTAKQRSDSQLIAENGSEPESQGLGTQLSPALLSKTTSVRVEVTEQPQEDDDESVSDSQGFHFQEENIEKAFVQCSDSESDDESSNSSSDHDGAREGATVKSSQSARTAAKATEAAAQVQSERSSSKDTAVKRRSPFKVKKKARPSQQSSQSDADVMREATDKLIGASQEEAAITDPIGGDNFPQTQAQDSREGFADADDSTTDLNESQTQMSQEAGTQDGKATCQVRVMVNSVLRTLTHGKEVDVFDQEREAGHLSQQPNSLDDQSQSASSSILFNAADLQHGFLTQAPDADSQNEPDTTERGDDDEGQTEGGDSFLPMDVDVWHTQPNEESQVFGFESFGNLNSQSQNEHEGGGRPISSFVNAEPVDSLQRIEEASEVPEFGVSESFADEQENRELQHHNQSQPESDNHQQSENLLSPKVASKQQARDSPRPKASLQSDEIPTKSRGRSEPGIPASSKPSSIPDGLNQVDLTRSGKASPSSTGLSSQKYSQKRSLGSTTSSDSSDPQPTTAAADAGANSSSSVMRQRKALRRTENSSPHQSRKGKAPVPSSAAMEKTNRNSFFDGVPLSILQRARQLQDELSATTSRNSNLSSSGSGGEPKSLRTMLDQLSQLHHDASQRPTGISSRRRDISSSSSTTSQPHVRPSKRYEHMFPPFRMDDLNKMILKKFSKSK